MRRRQLLSLLLLLFLPSLAHAATELQPVVSGLASPVALTHAGDPRLFITEVGGRVRVVSLGQLLATPFLDLSSRVSTLSGLGLWSVAFHPSFPDTPYLFAHYVERDTGDSLISRFTLSAEDPNRAEASSEAILLRIPKAVQIHYGGQLAFGPDGFLYLSTGDGTDGVVGPDPLCLSQKLDSLQGKLLRLDVDHGAESPPYYSVPPSNPFASGPFGEIWASGLRNPWRFSFDRESGDLWLSDVGENRHEEVMRQVATSTGGENYGWKIMEGGDCFSNLTGCDPTPVCNAGELTLPTIDYLHGQGRCSVIGGYVYRGSLVPELYGRYVFADFCTGEMWSTRAEAASFATSTRLEDGLPFLNSFGEDADGELYAMGGSTLYRLVDPSVTAAGVLEFTTTRGQASEGDGQLLVSVRRVGEGEGAVSVEVSTAGGTAVAGTDYLASSAVLTWADGELGVEAFAVPLLDDTSIEPTKTLDLTLTAASGGAALGPRRNLTIDLLDDDVCVDSTAQLCLNEDRFRVTAHWTTTDDEGEGQAVSLTDDGGYFWFFSSDNPEIFVKILNACVPPFDRYWVFIAGLTDVGTRIEVLDTESGEVKAYGTDVGQGFEAIRDTAAFACP